MESPRSLLGGFALEEYFVVRVRNDYQTRLRKLAALFQFTSNDLGHASCARKIWQIVSHVIRMEF